MLKWVKVLLMLASFWAGYTQWNGAYLIFKGEFAKLGGQALQEAAQSGVPVLIVVGFLLFFWPVYVASQEWRWRKK